MYSDLFFPFEKKMRKANLNDLVIQNFHFYFNQLIDGADGILSESLIQPPQTPEKASELDSKYVEIGKKGLKKTVILKLNGGLGTGMGLDKAKSLLPIRNSKTFLEIAIQQALLKNVPLILMNSYHTHFETKKMLDKFPNISGKFNPIFLQNRIPKIDKRTLQPAQWNDNPNLEWCPPGHGDLFSALSMKDPSSNQPSMLDQLIDAGIETAFISNSDNLGAVLDEKILGYFIDEGIPFLMEVANRTSADRKGGHLASSAGGRLLLREAAQCSPDDFAEFSNIEKYRYFNTNNLWINLLELRELFNDSNGILGLSLICNEKNVDPKNLKSPIVYQLETAMGSAIEVFPNAKAILVDRSRFAPVKNTSDLLIIRSDLYSMTEDFRIIQNSNRQGKLPKISLDSKFYQMLNDFESHFSNGIPSLLKCSSLKIDGEFFFGENITLIGDIYLQNTSNKAIYIADNAIIDSNYQQKYF